MHIVHISTACRRASAPHSEEPGGQNFKMWPPFRVQKKKKLYVLYFVTLLLQLRFSYLHNRVSYGKPSLPSANPNLKIGSKSLE